MLHQNDMYQEKLLQKAEAFEEAAKILRSQIPHRSRIWMKSIIDRKLGDDVTNFVADIRRFESTGHKRDTTWGEGGKKVEKRRVQNTMGYQTRAA
jgi:hypothetical protein